MDILPVRTAGAAENMALDFLLLQRYPEPRPRFRHYGWRAPAFTFGYAQKIEFVRSMLGSGEARADLCRRPTGGGIVDHQDDWTYALVIPRGHPLEEVRASHSYRVAHECLAEALRMQGLPAELNRADDAPPAPTALGVCFQRAELFDVVRSPGGAKIAGAAQKRNKRGLLFQGSVSRPAAGGDAVDWEKFQEDFARGLAAALGALPEPSPWPEWDESEVGVLIERYGSPEWIECR